MPPVPISVRCEPAVEDGQALGANGLRGQRRARDSQSPVPDDDEDEDAHHDKRLRPIILSARKKPTDEYGRAARQITRLVNMCWEPTSVINAGISLLALDPVAAEVEIASASDKKRALYDSFLTLCDLLPGIRDSTDWDLTRNRLEVGRTAAKTEDNCTFKTSLRKWHKWAPSLSPNKQECGLNHPECARLLCPTTVDWDDEDACNQFIIDQDPPMTAEDWPVFLYEGKPDPDDPGVGLMRSTLMVNALRAVIFPPSVADALSTESSTPDHQSNRRTKAHVYGMEAITPGLLAYVAVELRYALSSESTFNARGSGFDYIQFYNDLFDYLTDPESKDETDELMDWWNKKIFPPRHKEQAGATTGTRARLRRKARERAQANRNGDDG